MQDLKKKLLARQKHRAPLKGFLLKEAWHFALRDECAKGEYSPDRIALNTDSMFFHLFDSIDQGDKITRKMVEDSLQNEWAYVQKYTTQQDHHVMWDIKARMIEAVAEAANKQLADDNKIILGQPSEPPPHL